MKSTTIKVTDEKTGTTVEKNISASEMNKRRLEYARQLDAERYKDERTVPLSELNKTRRRNNGYDPYSGSNRQDG